MVFVLLCCLLCAVCSWLLVVGCLFFARCWFLLFVILFSCFLMCCLLFVVYYLLFDVIRLPLFVVSWLFLVVCCLLRAVCYVLPVVFVFLCGGLSLVCSCALGDSSSWRVARCLLFVVRCLCLVVRGLSY